MGMEQSIIKATWQLPKDHRAVAAFATKGEASEYCRTLVAEFGDRQAYYLTDLRGAWEVIRYL